MPASNQILSVAQMRAAEEALIARGSSVEALMDRAGRGAAEWVWRVAGKHRVTVLCGPGNNGGDGYVIAQAVLERGGDAVVVAAHEPRTAAACNAGDQFAGEVLGREAEVHGDVFVDCLFGSGLTRGLDTQDASLLLRLAGAHRHRIAVDLPSGVESDSGMPLSDGLPRYDLTLGLGAWKFAHVLMPSSAILGELRLVEIGVERVAGAAQVIGMPRLAAPAPGAHKYTRGLVAIVAGAMPGAAVLAGISAQGAGAGYVRLFSDEGGQVPHDLVLSTAPLAQALEDERIGAILIGPGLGRDVAARERLGMALSYPAPAVIDADALVLLRPDDVSGRGLPMIATPHEGELVAMERAFGCDGSGAKPARSLALAQASGMVVVAKGPDTVVAAPDGRIACAAKATSWLSTAGTGDVLAGTIASRLANHHRRASDPDTCLDAFTVACEGVWLHAEAARLCPPAFTASQLARAIPEALAACL